MRFVPSRLSLVQSNNQPHSMPSPPLQDMTGKVTKTERLLARGRLGDVWTGTFLWGDSSEIVSLVSFDVHRWSAPGCDQGRARCPIRHPQIRRAQGREYYPQWSCYSIHIPPKQLIGEAHLWSQLDHPNIMPFYGVCYGLGPESAPSLVSPFFSNGDLAGYLNNNPNADKMVLVSSYLHLGFRERHLLWSRRCPKSRTAWHISTLAMLSTAIWNLWAPYFILSSTYSSKLCLRG